MQFSKEQEVKERAVKLPDVSTELKREDKVSVEFQWRRTLRKE